MPLKQIVCTDELLLRRRRPPDYETENKALGRLVDGLARPSGTILQTLADTLQHVFGADYAGMSCWPQTERTSIGRAIAGAGARI